MARGIWKGTLGFGLVTIGVELLGAEAPERIDLDLLDKRDMSPVGYKKYSKTSGKEVQQADIVRGYQVTKGRYVVIEDKDLKAANPKATQTIDVFGFLPRGEIPLIFFAKPYLIAPTKGSEKAYLLFRDTLDQMEQVGLGQVVIRTRQYLAAVYPFDGALVVQLLRYADELRTPSESGVHFTAAADRAIRSEERSMAKRLVEGMKMKWNPAKYRDEYRDDLLAMIKRRAKGAKAVKEPAPSAEEPKVLDLVAALRRSLDSGKRTTTKHTTRATTHRTTKVTKRAKGTKRAALRRSA